MKRRDFFSFLIGAVASRISQRVYDKHRTKPFPLENLDKLSISQKLCMLGETPFYEIVKNPLDYSPDVVKEANELSSACYTLTEVLDDFGKIKDFGSGKKLAELMVNDYIGRKGRV